MRSVVVRGDFQRRAEDASRAVGGKAEEDRGLSANTPTEALLDNPRLAADRRLLQLTKERTAALRAR